MSDVISAGSTVDGSRSALAWVAFSELLALSLWFSASAVAPSLAVDWALDTGQVAGLTSWVQIGFVVGALAIAATNTADAVSSRTLFAASALLGATANSGLLLMDASTVNTAMLLRFVTGVALAGVYPSGMKIVAGWFRSGRGLALGVLIGALTIGSALPHLVRGFGLDWPTVVSASSLAAVASAGIVWRFVGSGPFAASTARFEFNQIGELARNRRYRLATLGYLGHMWELYALWAWAGLFLTASQEQSGSRYGNVAVITFIVIAIGAFGAWAAGVFSDRHGRATAASVAMMISGALAALSPVFFGASGWIVIALMLVWGAAVVADSAQFSVIVTEVTAAERRGTALTLQTALGFLLTLVTIRGTPSIADWMGWRWAFLWLAIGPLVGVIAMRRLDQLELLRRHP